MAWDTFSVLKEKVTDEQFKLDQVVLALLQSTDTVSDPACAIQVIGWIVWHDTLTVTSPLHVMLAFPSVVHTERCEMWVEATLVETLESLHAVFGRNEWFHLPVFEANEELLWG